MHIKRVASLRDRAAVGRRTCDRSRVQNSNPSRSAFT